MSWPVFMGPVFPGQRSSSRSNREDHKNEEAGIFLMVKLSRCVPAKAAEKGRGGEERAEGCRGSWDQ